MKISRPINTRLRATFEAAFGLSVLAAACTPATPDFVPLTDAGATTGTTTGGTTTTTGTTTGGTTTTTGTTIGSAVTGTTTGGTTTSTTTGTTTTGGTTTGTTTGGTTTTTGTTTGGTTTGGTTTTTGTTTGGTTTGTTTGGATTGTTTGADAGATGCAWIEDTTATPSTWSFDPTAPNKIVLFDGTKATFDTWHMQNPPTEVIQWTLNTDGTMTVVPLGTVASLVQTNMLFSNLCVHVEYMTPMYASSVVGQYRGNSGVYLRSAYEMQILDSSLDPPAVNTCGAVYGISAPLVVACLPELEWNTYEIEFKSSVWSTATPPVKTQDAVMVKSVLNGRVVQLNVDMDPAGGCTQDGIPDAPGPQPLGLQDHLDLVSFRNIWARVPQY